ncbi:MAG TPA: DUF3754 domain-containing protein [Isosphaeraceae bacterium]|jgi:hypothetical protein|nr:DUF3754 domain-containing protein [Isosphaeraceae bacterium]
MATDSKTIATTAPPPIPLPGRPVPVEEPRDRCIPVRPADLTRALLDLPALAPHEREGLQSLAKMLEAYYHHEFLDWQNELKDLYAPLDPDVDCVDVAGHSRKLADDTDERFLKPFEAALLRANFRELGLGIIEQAIEAPNEHGLNYVPNFDLFEHLRVFVRGKATITRTVRNVKTRFRRRQILFEGYRRLIVVLKFKPGKKLRDDYVRSDVLYLRLFKDVPHVDMEMHLPEQGAKVKMRLVDKAQIASPIAVGIPTAAMKLLGAVGAAGIFGLASLSTAALGAIMVAPISAGVNSFFGFHRAKQKHLHRMIRHLFYLSMANNASVITRLIDQAEEEEYKEALLAYVFLHLGRDEPEPWTPDRLDARIESYLHDSLGINPDFEIADALGKLVRLGLVRQDRADRLEALPLDNALAILDERWDDLFRHAPPSRARVEDGERDDS